MQVIVRFGLLVLLVSLFVCNLHAQALTASTVAGNGIAAFAGDGGPPTLASLASPQGVAVDGAGNIYVADTFNNRIRKVSLAGVITTIAGNGTAGYSGDGDAAPTGQINGPVDVASDATGTFLYIADQGNNRLRRVFQGFMTTAAGNGSPDFTGDGAPPLSSGIGPPTAVAVDLAGNVYFTVTSQHRVRKLTPSGLLTTIAGNGVAGFSGDGSSASSAQLNSPAHVAVDAVGNVYIADTANYRVRRVSTGGVITTVAGNGTAGISGDGGSALSASIGTVWGVAVDLQGNVYFTSTNYPTVRKVSFGGVITTVAGTGTAGFSGDGGLALLAQFGTSMSIAVDTSRNLFLADPFSQRIRELQNVTSSRIGSFAHIASGGNWKTTLTLVNLSVSPIDAQIRFYSNDGSPLTLPLTFPLSGLSSTSDTTSVTIGPSSTAVVESAATTASTAVGWADVQATGPLSGYTIFRYGTTNSEGTVPLENGTSSLVLPYDNRNGAHTGFALANQSSATAVSVLLLDQSGFQIGSGQLNLNAFGHDSKFLEELFPQAVNRVGIIRFQTPNGLITGIGLRFSPTGSFTSVPIAR